MKGARKQNKKVLLSAIQKGSDILIMKKICLLWGKYKGIISYLFFGICTTVINVVIYNILYFHLQMSNVSSTAVAWILAVVFAFATNKMFVFESLSWKFNVLKHELISFFGCRLLTGIMDIVIMYLMVDCLDQNAMLWKWISNVLVIILNYVASKIVIFRDHA